jgi:beta-phosphoglucomutase-like phosphatase (HAD superfamily)
MSASMTDPAFLFDLDGTRVDSVYQHVLAWREALDASGIQLVFAAVTAAGLAYLGQSIFGGS